MTSRELFILVFRGVGLWAVVQALGSIQNAITNVVNAWDFARTGATGPDGVSVMQSLVTAFVQPGVQLLVAACLLFGTARISKFFCNEPDAAEQPRSLAVASEDLCRTFVQVVGLCAFLRSVPSLAHVGVSVARWSELASLTIHDVAKIVQVVLYLGCAFTMVFGAKRIARWLTELRGVPGVADS